MIWLHNEEVERPHAYNVKSQSLRFMCEALCSLDPAQVCLDSTPSLFPLIPSIMNWLIFSHWCRSFQAVS